MNFGQVNSGKDDNSAASLGRFRSKFGWGKIFLTILGKMIARCKAVCHAKNVSHYDGGGHYKIYANCWGKCR